MNAGAFDRIRATDAPVRRLARGETTLTRILAARLTRKPLRSLGVAMALAATAAIFGNILLMQPEQHRAPMFVGNPRIHPTPVPTQGPLPPVRPSGVEKDAEALRRAELVREIQVELGRRGFWSGDPDPAAAARTAKAIRDFQGAAGLPASGEPSDALLAAILTANVRPRDQIATLLRNSADRFERPETVAAMQRALTRLGYGPLKDDGQFGPGTRAALDRFEKDRKLPSRSDNAARVIRELAQASGIPID